MAGPELELWHSEKERKKRAGEPNLLPFIVNLVQPFTWMRFFVLFCCLMHCKPLERSSREGAQGGEVSASLQVEQGFGSALCCPHLSETLSSNHSFPARTVAMFERKHAYVKSSTPPIGSDIPYYWLGIRLIFGCDDLYVLERVLEEGGNRRQDTANYSCK